jgi:23S rRNA-/tRNA-specific pseudouridylate synthase
MQGTGTQIRAHLAYIGHPIANDTGYHDGEGHVCPYDNTHEVNLEPPRRQVYTDDAEGTLAKLLKHASVFRDWCPKVTALHCVPAML